jgi:hypothetical protein
MDSAEHESKGDVMHASTSSLALISLLLTAPALQAQDLSPRMGIAFFLTSPTDSAAKLYGSGWKANLTVHVHRESLVEGRVRMEVGEFSQGDGVNDYGYGGYHYSANTRLVSYDWLIPLGQKRETGADLVLGIGGAHWYRHRSGYSTTTNAYWQNYSDTENQLAFAATVGFRLRLSRKVELELHQVFTSTPGNQKDIEDGELSHTALGVGLRF